MFSPFTETNLETKNHHVQLPTKENQSFIPLPHESPELESDDEFDEDEFEVMSVYDQDYYNYDPVHAVCFDPAMLDYWITESSY